MTIQASDYSPALKQGANLDANTLSVASTATFTGVATFTAAPVFTANPIAYFETVTAATKTVTAAMTGGTFLATASSGTQTFTLPAVAAGLRYTFICGHASGEILINTAASEVTKITSFAAVGADADTGIVTTAGGTGIKNTAATNAIGDSVTLVSDGVGWYGIGITSGIWASQ